MRTLHLLLYIVAAICFAAAILVPSPTHVDRTVTTADTGVGTGTAVGTGTVIESVTRRLQLVAAGLFVWLLNPIISIIDDMVD